MTVTVQILASEKRSPDADNRGLRFTGTFNGFHPVRLAFDNYIFFKSRIFFQVLSSQRSVATDKPKLIRLHKRFLSSGSCWAMYRPNELMSYESRMNA